MAEDTKKRKIRFERYRLKNMERFAEYTRQWRLRNRDKVLAGYRTGAGADPAKVKVRNAVAHAIRDGKLTRRPCEVCGAEAQAHHEDYSRPLDVKWLCRKHHAEVHRRVISAAA